MTGHNPVGIVRREFIIPFIIPFIRSEILAPNFQLLNNRVQRHAGKSAIKRDGPVFF